mmetsp:Transcript_6166/g.11541  ORF Transcript_6166/g.11541 Transcript_6166/m.11541 type:complete len:440 (+) Transcript_6166:140-1459(+)
MASKHKLDVDGGRVLLLAGCAVRRREQRRIPVPRQQRARGAPPRRALLGAPQPRLPLSADQRLDGLAARPRHGGFWRRARERRGELGALEPGLERVDGVTPHGNRHFVSHHVPRVRLQPHHRADPRGDGVPELAARLRAEPKRPQWAHPFPARPALEHGVVSEPAPLPFDGLHPFSVGAAQLAQRRVRAGLQPAHGAHPVPARQVDGPQRKSRPRGQQADRPHSLGARLIDGVRQLVGLALQPTDGDAPLAARDDDLDALVFVRVPQQTHGVAAFGVGATHRVFERLPTERQQPLRRDSGLRGLHPTKPRRVLRRVPDWLQRPGHALLRDLAKHVHLRAHAAAHQPTHPKPPPDLATQRCPHVGAHQPDPAPNARCLSEAHPNTPHLAAPHRGRGFVGGRGGGHRVRGGLARPGSHRAGGAALQEEAQTGVDARQFGCT